MVLFVSTRTKKKKLTCLFAFLLTYSYNKSNPSPRFHFCTTVLSYYEEKQNEQSDGVCETRWWQTAVLCLAAQLVPAANSNPSKYPEPRSERDYTVLTLIKAPCLKKSSICCFSGTGCKKLIGHPSNQHSQSSVAIQSCKTSQKLKMTVAPVCSKVLKHL